MRKYGVSFRKTYTYYLRLFLFVILKFRLFVDSALLSFYIINCLIVLILFLIKLGNKDVNGLRLKTLFVRLTLKNNEEFEIIKLLINNICIDHDLTKDNQALYRDARRLGKEKEFQFV